MKIVVAGRCLNGNCDCKELDGLNTESYDYPPYHDD